MIVSTPPAQYDQTVAIRLLQDYDQQTVVNPEILSMVNDKILVKHASASLTGRFYSFAQSSVTPTMLRGLYMLTAPRWLSQAQGPFPAEIHKEATATTARLQGTKPVDWNLMNTGGEIAALMSSISDHQVDCTFDIKRFPTVAADQGIYNTRKLSKLTSFNASADN